MYELRIKLPYLDPKNPEIDRLKRELIEQVIKTGMVASYATGTDLDLYALVEVEPSADDE